jgi:hypothetical protein
LNGQAGTPVEAAFAPARYFVMSDDDKLAAPSFETMDAGLVLGDDTVTYDAATIVPAPLDYVPITLAPLPAPGTAAASGVAPKLAAPTLAPPTAATPPPRYSLPLEVLQRHQTSGAAARVPVRRVGRARFRNGAAAPAATVKPPRWRIVRVSDASPAPVDARVTTWSEYRDVLATLNRGGAQWLMVPEHEIKA